MSYKQNLSKSRYKPTDTWFTTRWLYDELMGKIEPDLTSLNIGKLEQKYKGESSKDRQERLNHYEHAFAVYELAMEDFAEELNTEMEEWGKFAKSRALKADEEATEETLHELAAEIDITTPDNV